MASGNVTDELAALQETFPKQVRILNNVGEIAHMVDIKPEGVDLSYKFQLTDSYPSTPPEIILRSKKLLQNDSERLGYYLKERADAYKGKPMIADLVKDAEKWIEGEGIDILPQAKAIRQSKKQPLKDLKKKSKKKSEDEHEIGKKAPMRTAEQVIQRICWDPELPKDYFIVGYLDRFKGVVEGNFTAFSWDDIASVDYNTLAIPQHRIHYFKYKDMKVWDKNDRLDNFFGSTGSNKTIHDVIRIYEEENPGQDFDHKKVDNNDGEDDDDDDDDNVKLDVGKYESSDITSTFKPQLTVQRPNHFICLQIMDQEILNNVEKVQKSILEQEARFEESMVPLMSCHITLCTLGLDSAADIALANDVLNQMQPDLVSLLKNQVRLTIKGVDNFYEKVLFGKIDENHGLLNFVNDLKRLLTKANISVRDQFDFKPHMTIMKIGRSKAPKMIESKLYHEFKDLRFGVQNLDVLHLCPMSDVNKWQSDGFYRKLCSINLF